MKKIIFLLFFTIGLSAQDLSVSTSLTYTDTLTSTVDTVDITMQTRFDYVHLLITPLDAQGTITVYTISADGVTWTPRTLTLLEDLSIVSNITTTTAKEYLVNDVEIKQLRLVSSGTDSTIFYLRGKIGSQLFGGSLSNNITVTPLSSTSTVKLDTLYTASNHWVWLSEIFADTSAIKFLYIMNQDDIANIYLGSDSVNTVKIGAENDFIDAIQWYDSTSTVGIKTDSTNTPIMIYIGK